MTTVAFHRPARWHPPVPPAEPVAIAASPALPGDQGRLAGALQSLAPVTVSLGSVAFILGSGAGRGWLIYLLPTVIGAGVALSVGVRWAQNRAARDRRRLHARRYLGLLEQHEVVLRERARLQRSAESRVHPDLDRLSAMAICREQLWERRLSDADFLRTRIGRGSGRLISPASAGRAPDPFADYDPGSLDAAAALVSRYSSLPGGVITADLGKVGSLAVIGDTPRCRALVRALLVQLSCLCAPEDLSLGLYFPAEARGEWEWAKWLPHTRSGEAANRIAALSPVCRLADTATGLQSVLARATRPRLERLSRLRAQSPAAASPGSDLLRLGRLVLVIDGFAAGTEISRLQALGELLPVANQAGVTVITLVEHGGDEPGHLDARLTVDRDGRVEYTETAPTGHRTPRSLADAVDPGEAEAIARLLAPLRLSERRSDCAELAGSIRLLELLRIPSASAVNPSTSWRRRAPREVLRVPLGVGADGEPVILDLKEAAEGGMGPHGLVIGATGSGKSELLRTLVTGLAITHPPDTLNFVFVDFKGGAAFAELATLPHVAGMITNLQADLTQADRMRAGLVGEQQRRQQLLRSAGNLDGIKEYERRRHRHRDMAPMPHLMIVVDECGELLTARPDFLDLFVATGRVGRSLGMHLLLATQRLDDGRIRGLEGLLRYRICLRTFSSQESQAVLGTSDAYNLPSHPGAGFFKVDTTVYQRFKTAQVTAAACEPTETRSARPTVTVFTGLNRPDEDSPGAALSLEPGDDAPTEMGIAIRNLKELGCGLGPPVHQVWLPPLDAHVAIDSVQRLAAGMPDQGHGFDSLRATVGIVDLPAQQQQQPLVIDFAHAGGHLAVVGAPQTGKSTFLRTLIAGLALTHSPEQAQFYCVDFGGGGLHSLEALPHVGGVAGRLEPERLRRLVRHLGAIIEEREILFRKLAIESMASFRRKRRAGELPAGTADAFLVIDGWAEFRQECDDADSEIVRLCRGGLAYGVHVVLAAGRWADIRTNLRDMIGGRLEFRLNDPMDSEMPRGTAMTLPPNIPGRGLTPQGLHFQTALPRIDSQARSSDLQPALVDMVGSVKRLWPGSLPAPRVRVLPLVVTAADLPDTGTVEPAGVPLGVEEIRLEPVFVDLRGGEPHALILGDGGSGKSTLIRGWMQQLSHRHTPDEVQFIVVDYRRGLLDVAASDHVAAYLATPALTAEMVERLRHRLTSRLPPAELTRRELMARSWWRGPEYFLFVDDYDLVAAASGNPLQPLVELLAQARDVGFHLVLARRIGGIARGAFEPVYQRVRELGSPGFILSGDPQEGPVLGTQRAQVLPSGRGYLVRRGQRTTLVQTLQTEPGDD